MARVSSVSVAEAVETLRDVWAGMIIDGDLEAKVRLVVMISMMSRYLQLILDIHIGGLHLGLTKKLLLKFGIRLGPNASFSNCIRN